MLKPLRILGLSILCVQIAFPVVRAEDREPTAVSKYIDRRDIKPIKLGYEASNRVRTLLFKNIEEKMHLASNILGFQSMYGIDLSASDQRGMAIVMSRAGELPKFTRAGDRLIATLGGHKLTIEWPDPLKSELRINGMKFILRLDKPVLEQAAVLAERLHARKPASVADLWLPRANAHSIKYGFDTAAEVATRVGFLKRLWNVTKSVKEAAVIGGVVVVFQGEFFKTMGTSLFSGLREGFCRGINYVNKVGVLTACSDWDKERTEKDWKEFTRLDSLIVIENASKGGRIIESEELACPTKNDKKDRVLLAKIRPVEWKNGVKVPLRDDFSMLRAVFDPEGNPKSLLVGPSGVDLEKKLETEDGRNEIWLNIGFAKEGGQVTSIEMSNPAYKDAKEQRRQQITSDKGVLSQATHKILGDAEPATFPIDPTMKLTPQQQERLSNAHNIIKWAKAKTFECVVSRAIVQIEQGINPTMAADPGVADPGISTVQPAKAAK